MILSITQTFILTVTFVLHIKKKYNQLKYVISLITLLKMRKDLKSPLNEKLRNSIDETQIWKNLKILHQTLKIRKQASKKSGQKSGTFWVREF